MNIYVVDASVAAKWSFSDVHTFAATWQPADFQHVSCGSEISPKAPAWPMPPADTEPPNAPRGL